MPDNSYGEAHYAFVARTLEAIVPHYQREGYVNLFIPYVFENRIQLIKCVQSLSKPGQKIFTFILRGSEDSLTKQVENRSSGLSPHHRDSRLQHDLKRSMELKQILDAGSLTGSLGEVVETDGLSPPDIANHIAQRIRSLTEKIVSDSYPSAGSITFAPKYVPWILQDLKTATTRRITSSTIIPQQGAGFFAVVRGESMPFAICFCYSVESTKCSAIDDTLARMENLPDASALVNELKIYYPDIDPISSNIYIQKFYVHHFFPPPSETDASGRAALIDSFR